MNATSRPSTSRIEELSDGESVFHSPLFSNDCASGLPDTTSVHLTDYDQDAASVSVVAIDFSTGDARDSDLSGSPELAPDDLQGAEAHDEVVEAPKGLWHRAKAAGRALRGALPKYFIDLRAGRRSGGRVRF